MSKKDIPHAEDWKTLSAQFLNNIGEKSFRNVYMGSMMVLVMRNDHEITLLPTTSFGDRGRFDHLPKLEIKISMEPDKKQMVSISQLGQDRI